jgi:hypothetical protein
VNRDDQDAALAQKEQDERRRFEDEQLASDPDYLKWLNQLNEQVKHEVPSEG